LVFQRNLLEKIKMGIGKLYSGKVMELGILEIFGVNFRGFLRVF
jgi:hypothetical protein